MLQSKSFTGEITGNLAHQSTRGNMHKLFDCIKTPLKRFAACLIFHRKEIRFCNSYKKTNPGSDPEVYVNPFVSNALFLYPLKTSENQKAFWCFQWVEEGCIGNKYLKRKMQRLLLLFMKQAETITMNRTSCDITSTNN